MVFNMTWEMYGFSHQFPIAWKNGVTSFMGETLGVDTHTFQNFFSFMKFPTYGILHHMGNGEIACKNVIKAIHGKNLGHRYRYFFQGIGASVPSSCHSMLFYII